MLVTTRLKYVAENEWGPRRYLDVTPLDIQPHRRAGQGGCRKVRKTLDVPYPSSLRFNPDSFPLTFCFSDGSKAHFRMRSSIAIPLATSVKNSSRLTYGFTLRTRDGLLGTTSFIDEGPISRESRTASSALTPFSVLQITADTPRSSTTSGWMSCIPQKSPKVRSLPQQRFAGQSRQLSLREALCKNALIYQSREFSLLRTFSVATKYATE